MAVKRKTSRRGSGARKITSAVKKRKAAAQKSAVKKKGLTDNPAAPPSQTLGKVSAVKKQDRVKGAEAAPTQVEAAGAGASVPPAFPIVGVGASAGGLEAFEAFFKDMPATSGMAFVLVSHLDPTHVSILPELLQKHTAMPVRQIGDGARVEPDTVYVLPPNKTLSILNGVLQLMDLHQPRGVNLPIDAFFRSLAQDQGSNAIGVILSGTGSDGTLGLKAIKGEAGMVMVQDEDSAKYSGMPHSAVATGLADYVLPPNKMPAQLIKYTKHATHRTAPQVTSLEGTASNALSKIFVVLRARTGHDFSLYKKNTICRRIERRMHVHQIDDLSDYVRYVQESEREVDVLFKELLIGVTSFFRDPEAFDALRDKVLPNLLAERPENYTLRAWVPGCSSGEEAYSIAIVLQECMGPLQRHFNVQVFGTDIDKDAVNAARTGLYPASISADVSAERLQRHFVKEDDGQYRIKKHIREMLVFAPQNVIKDPPFTKLDLLCCRNLLIYLGPELQQRLLPMFHYSLKPEGILFLGSSETIGPAIDLFSLIDRKWKICRRKGSAVAGPLVVDFPGRSVQDDAHTRIPETVRRAEELSAVQLVKTILQQTDAPPCVIIDDACNVIYIHGRTGRYLEPAMGRISVNILEMARPGLKAELAAAVRRVARHKQEVTVKSLRLEYNGGHLVVDLIVKPILEQSAMQGLMMVMFVETAGRQKPEPDASKPKPPATKGKCKNVLELELQTTKENLQTTIEELETSNEELKSTNEELQSTNEELQSTNEELETSKEELQSLNEEAATVNAELQNRIDGSSKANNDMKNLLDSTKIAILFVDMDLCIRRFTPQITEIMPLTGTDCGRPIKHFASQLFDVDLSRCAERVLRDLGIHEQEVKTKQDRCFTMRIRPYRTTDNVIDGVVITFDDVTAIKKVQHELHAAKAVAEGVVASVRQPLLVLDSSLRVVSANDSFCRTFQVSASETIGRLLYELGNDEWDIAQLRQLLEEILPGQMTIDAFEIEHDFPRIGPRKIVLSARQLAIEAGGSGLILLAIEDANAPRH